MHKFRIPRKLKKLIKKDMWFYPMDEATKTYRMIFPCDSQKNFDEWRMGKVQSLKQQIKKLKAPKDITK